MDQEDLHVNTKEVKAIKEVRSDLNILKSQCGSKVKEYALERVRMITPESDLEVDLRKVFYLQSIQKNEFSNLFEIMKFLKKHITKTYDDVRERMKMLINRFVSNILLL